LKVMSDILLALDSGDLAMLTLLDLSAAFVKVDHYIFLKRLNISYGISHSVLGWLTCYVSIVLSSFSKRLLLQVVSRHLWCTSRFGPGTDLVSFIHRRPHPTGGRAQPSSPSVRGRHTGVRLL